MVNHQKLRIVNWHLGLAETERQWQVRHLLEHHRFRAIEAQQTLIIGDFNDWRNQLGHGPFAVHHYRQLTAPPSRYRTFPAWMPLGSLDKAYWQGPSSAMFHTKVVRSKLAKDASDHLPLVVELLKE
jgi:endonuclease/exonuclease/phosphatase family metal-dependent hydrolase